MNEISKLSAIIPKGVKKRMIIISFLLFVSVIIEILSLSSVYPFIDIIINDSDKYSEILFRFFNVKLNQKEIISFSIISILLLFLFKTFYVTYFTYRQHRFSQNFTKQILLELFSKFFNKEHSQFVNRNSGEFIRDFDLEIRNFSQYFESLLVVISEVILICVISIFLIFLNPAPTIISFLFIFISGFIIYKLPKRYIESLGIKLRSLDIGINSVLIESFNGFKEIVFLKKQDIFLQKLDGLSSDRVSVISRYKTFAVFPKVAIEFIAVIGIIIYSIYSSLVLNANELFVNLSLLVASTFKILPSINRLISNFHLFRYHHTSVETIYSKLNETFILNHNEKNSGDIYFKDVSISFNEKPILENLNFKINKGDIFGIYGKSGVGKSTILNLITGLVKPTSGEIFIDSNKSTISRKGFVSQESFIFNDSILFNITFKNDILEIDKIKFKQALELANITTLFKDIGLKKLGENGSKLSGGQKQRISIARSIYNDAETFLFDEPTSSLDNNNVDNFILTINNLNKLGKTIIIVTHSKKIIDKINNKIEIK